MVWVIFYSLSSYCFTLHHPFPYCSSSNLWTHLLHGKHIKRYHSCQRLSWILCMNSTVDTAHVMLPMTNGADSAKHNVIWNGSTSQIDILYIFTTVQPICCVSHTVSRKHFKDNNSINSQRLNVLCIVSLCVTRLLHISVIGSLTNSLQR